MNVPLLPQNGRREAFEQQQQQRQQIRRHNNNPPPRHVFQIRGRTETEEAELAAALGLPVSRIPSMTRHHNHQNHPSQPTILASQSASTLSNNQDYHYFNSAAAEANNNRRPTRTATRETNQPAQVDDDENQEYQQELRYIFGRPYARNSCFWCLHLPGAALLGMIVGMMAILFVGASELWWTHLGWMNVHEVNSIEVNGRIKITSRHWTWIAALTGGLLTSFFLVVIPALEMVVYRISNSNLQTLNHNFFFLFNTPSSVIGTFAEMKNHRQPGLLLSSLSSHFSNLEFITLFTLSGVVALTSRAPVGPELVVGILAILCGAKFSLLLLLPRRRLSSSPQQEQQGEPSWNSNQEEDNNDEEEENNPSLSSHELQFSREQQEQISLQQRTIIQWTQVALAAAITPFVPSPVVGPVFALELGLVVSAASSASEKTASTPLEDYDHDHTTYKGHDHVEQFSLQLVACLVSSVSAQMVSSIFHSDLQWSLKPFANVDYTYRHWHLLVATAVGLASGLLSSLAQLVAGAARRCRLALCHSTAQWFPNNILIPTWVVPSLCPLLAALINGLLMGHVAPMATGSGIGFIRQTVKSVFNPQDGDSNRENITMKSIYISVIEQAYESNRDSNLDLILAALIKIVGLAVSTHLGGFVGGSVVPLLYCGCCLGLVLGNVAARLQQDEQQQQVQALSVLTLACAMLATPFSTTPFPATATILTLTLFPSSSSSSSSSVLVMLCLLSCLVSWLLVGGLGMYSVVPSPPASSYLPLSARNNRHLGGPVGGRDDVNDDGDPGEEPDPQHPSEEANPQPSTEEILQSIRTAIFGG